MNSFLTQCPHCHTSFRITERQSQAADGLVRCGACLGIFSAPDFRIRVREERQQNEIYEEYTDDESAQADETPEWQDRDEQDDEAEEDETGDDDSEEEFEEYATDAAEPATEPVRHHRELAALRDYDIPLGDLNLNDIQTETLLEDDELVAGEYPQSDNHHEQDDESEDDYESDDDLPDTEEDWDEDWDDDSVQASDQVRDTEPNDLDESGEDSDDDADRESEAVPEEDWEEDGDDDLEPTPLSEKEAYRRHLARLAADQELEPVAASTLASLDEDPVLLEAPPRRSRLASFGLFCLNLLLCSLLGLQYLAFNIESLAGSATLQPLLPVLCRVLDCPAPQRSDLASLRSRELLVRSHPRYAGALEVSIIFSNDSPQAQPFPALELSFADSGNRVLSNRLFRPADYLPAELRNLPEMPAQSSVQVLLELADPGSAAVNYTLAFREP